MRKPPTEALGMWDMMDVLVKFPFYQGLKAQASGPESEAARQVRRLVNLYQKQAEDYVIYEPHTKEDAELFKDVLAKLDQKGLDRLGARFGKEARETAQGVVNEMWRGLNR